MESVLRFLATLSTRHPRTLLATLTVISVSTVFVAMGLDVQTSRNALVEESHDFWQRYMDFAEEFGLPEDMVVVIEGTDPARVRAATDAVAARLAEHKDLIGDPFYKVDLEAMADKAVLYLEDEQLDLLDKLMAEPALAEAVVAPSSGARLEAVARLLDRAPSLQTKGGEKPPAAEALVMAQTLERAAAELKRYSEQGKQAGSTLELYDRDAILATGAERLEGSGLDVEGYLTADGGKTGVMFLRARDQSDDIAKVEPFVRKVRALCDEVIGPMEGVSYGLSGVPALQVEELEALNSGALETSLVAVTGVAILFILYFPTLSLLLLSLVPVLFAVLWTAAAVALSIGHVNLMSMVFLVVLIGMGIDFSIHISARFLEFRRAGLDPREAAFESVMKAGRGILTGGLTSSGAFLGLLLSGFKGIMELGIAASMGMGFALLFGLTILPAVLSLSGHKIPHSRQGFPGLGRLVDGVIRYRLAVLVVAAVVTAGAAYASSRTPFDISLTNLMPKDSEAAQLMVMMNDKQELNANAVASVVENLDDARELEEKFRQLEVVHRSVSAATLLPTGQDARMSRLGAAREALNKARSAARRSGVADRSVGEGLDRLEATIERLQDLAFRDGATDAVAAMEKALGAVADARDLLESDDPGTAARAAEGLALFADRLVALISGGLERFEATVAAGPMRAEDLPAAIRGRFYSDKGRYAVYAFPAHPIDTREGLERFVSETGAVAGHLTGYPETFHHNTTLIVEGFQKAVVYSFFAVLLLLLFDIRRPHYVLAAMVPVTFGAVWMLGLMYIVDMPYNLANIMSVPLIIGVGVDNGVHLCHRYLQDKDTRAAALHTGGAVMLSSLTTMVGFGALALAPHRGVASMGMVLFLGVGACLVASMTVVPALLAMIDARRAKQGIA